MMSWGTYYKYEGYISHVGKNELEHSLEEEKRLLELYWQRLLAYAAATPPATAKSELGTEYPYPEFIADEFRSIRQEMEDCYWGIHHKQDCLDALKEHPEEVEEG